ncbi:fibronectin type III domain-containing protein [Myxococcus sp. Y35]|uniref:fibronectin type III domain-containing protein n=1 Tax=Pseudomyxococcus flavus TaxID=3115648 RepID=UPI003CEF62C1
MSAIAGDAQATVSWSAPVDEGSSPILGYVVRALLNGEVARSQESTSTSVTVSGLTNGETYRLVVAARNAQGEGPASVPSEPVIPHVIPGAPREVTAAPGDRSIEVAWAPPEDTGMPITGYTVTVREGEATVATQTSTELRATVSGLTNGTGYRVTVAATNAVVGGPESAPVAVTPVSVPGAPSLTLYGRSRTALGVTWEDGDTGGSPITGYHVELSLEGTVVQAFDTTEKRQAFLGLTTGAPYRITVAARNAVGLGAVGELPAVRPCLQPDPVPGVLGTYGDGQFSLWWLQPADTGGCEITHYAVTVAPVRAGSAPTLREQTTETRLVVTGLVNGVEYEVVVFVHTEAGSASISARWRGTPYPVPEAPRNLVATPGDGHVLLEWEPPPYLEGNLSRYVATVEPEVEGLELGIGRSSVSWMAEGLTNGTTYTFTIRGENSAGLGPPATVQATPMAP